MKTGQILLKTSLIMQLCVMTLFVILAAHFHRRCIKNGIRTPRVTTPLVILYISNAIITVRTIYRTVEHFGQEQLYFEPGMDLNDLSPLIRHEWYFYVFEAVPMLGAVVLMNYFHPGKYLPQNSKIYLAKDGITEVQGPGYNDDRPLILTLFDPFDFIGLVTRRGMKDKQFWDEGVLKTTSRHESIDSDPSQPESR